MSYEFQFPENALVNKFVAKTKFYEKVSLSSKLQNEFINKIQKITCKYKLTEDSTGISKTDDVTEIQIFEVVLKEQVIPKNVLKVIDRAIPYQILYQFIYNDNVAYGITLNGGVLRNISEKGNAEQNCYFSEWNEILNFDFTGNYLEKVYQKLITLFINNEAKDKNDSETIIDVDNRIKHYEKEISVLKNKISR